MIGRAAVDDETLKALGWMTILHSGLEEFLSHFTAQLFLSEDFQLALGHVAPMPVDRKRDLMKELVKHHNQKYKLQSSDEIIHVLGRTKELTERRNGLIHGFTSIEKGSRLPVAIRPGRKQSYRIAADEIDRLCNEISVAHRDLLNAHARFWKELYHARKAQARPSRP
ncbi:MAG: hypothetical protein WD696_01745 [Bryobacteraceae bacterium]